MQISYHNIIFAEIQRGSSVENNMNSLLNLSWKERELHINGNTKVEIWKIKEFTYWEKNIPSR